MIKPKVCILRSDGTNCDEELFYAFEKFGASPQYVQVNELRDKNKKLKNFQILALPGGFSYGDDIASGKVLALELISYLKDELQSFIARKGLILGVCNGFQTLVRTGLLPFNNLGKMDATLTLNESGHFECRWVKIKLEKSKCLFLNPKGSEPGLSTYSKPGSDLTDLNGNIDVAINSGEGKFFTDERTLNKIESQNLVVFRYVDQNGQPTQNYPLNPNGSINAIAGITDPTGRILGLMPHPEKFVDFTQHPNWRRFDKNKKPHGAFIFENMISYASGQ